MEIPKKCKAIVVIYEDGGTETFIPTSKIDEWEDSYEFEIQKNSETHMVVVMKSVIRNIGFVKG